MKIKSRRLVVAASLMCTIALNSCSMSGGEGKAQPRDTTMFCILLSAHMMTSADYPAAAAIAEDDQKMQEYADRIASNESEYAGLSQTTSQFIAATNATDGTAARTLLQSYCKAHGLSPSPLN
ncbi:hypothetical protein G3I60_08995 [Streptomyces sp. SID13666]|uniref:hypothetical protein n=1 Tax=unclassified Streptomyces TaxID=2593676 RepID=UPI0013C0BEB4|nr:MULTISPECIES: hypothetical protein [unclassified Streptomyces]NEA54283.1 hypothetical protein [Streptomyces sp. SID13666]NEA70378.1 hypothetical protein [Streptomyces sp. SID13588]